MREPDSSQCFSPASPLPEMHVWASQCGFDVCEQPDVRGADVTFIAAAVNFSLPLTKISFQSIKVDMYDK